VLLRVLIVRTPRQRESARLRAPLHTPAETVPPCDAKQSLTFRPPKTALMFSQANGSRALSA
jgi:hypothetical protein